MTAIQLAMLFLLALAGPLLSLLPKAHIPANVTQLLVGILVGNSVLGWVSAHDPIFTFLGNTIGFSLVMFVAGTHVPIRSSALRASLKPGLFRATAIALLAIPAGWMLATIFNTPHAWIYAIIIASSPAAVILPSLKSAQYSSTHITEMLVQIAIADVIATILLPLAIEPADALRKGAGVSVIIVASCLLAAILQHFDRTGEVKKLKRLSEKQELALQLRLCLIALFALVALGETFGISPMLASFCCGMVVSTMRKRKRLSNQFFALTEGFFGPFFFLWLGASLQLHGLFENPKMLWLSVGIIALSIIAHGAMLLTQQPPSYALLTVAQLGVPAAAVSVGIEAGIFEAGEDAALMLGAIFSLFVVAIAAPRVVKASQEQKLASIH